MGNQQAKINNDRLMLLGRNAKLGDGYLWKHPESTNYKVIYTSTTPELLRVKYNLCPSIFSTGVRECTVGNGGGRYANAKQLYRLASTTHPLFTSIALRAKEDLYKDLTVEDFGLWYLDDGCYVKRTDSNSYRFYLCVGDSCSTDERLYEFTACLTRIFGSKHGCIRPNNSKATENNKSWVIPKGVARVILKEASRYEVLKHKFPEFI